jgi:hypothetical protein
MARMTDSPAYSDHVAIELSRGRRLRGTWPNWIGDDQGLEPGASGQEIMRIWILEERGSRSCKRAWRERRGRLSASHTVVSFHSQVRDRLK